MALKFRPVAAQLGDVVVVQTPDGRTISFDVTLDRGEWGWEASLVFTSNGCQEPDDALRSLVEAAETFLEQARDGFHFDGIRMPEYHQVEVQRREGEPASEDVLDAVLGSGSPMDPDPQFVFSHEVDGWSTVSLPNGEVLGQIQRWCGAGGGLSSVHARLEVDVLWSNRTPAGLKSPAVFESPESAAYDLYRSRR